MRRKGARVAGDVDGPPEDYVELDKPPLETELREAVNGPWGQWAELPTKSNQGRAGHLSPCSSQFRRDLIQ